MDDGKVERPWAGNNVGAMGSVVRLLTWNINGLRKVAAGYGSLKALLDQFEADVGKGGVCVLISLRVS